MLIESDGGLLMNAIEKRNLFKQAKEWMILAGEKIKEQMKQPIDIDSKENPNDLVTSIDRAIEEFFAKKIREHYPDHFILGEEGYGDEIKSLKGTLWIIDPIDGTINFVHQRRNFAISIGIFHEGIGEIGFIYDVMANELYYALRGEGAFKNNRPIEALNNHVTIDQSLLSLNHFWLYENEIVDEKAIQFLVSQVRGTRTLGSAALEMVAVAEGKLDGYLSLNLAPWDIAGGIILIHEVGGIVTNHQGNKINMLESSPVIASHKDIHKDLISFLMKGKK